MNPNDLQAKEAEFSAGVEKGKMLARDERSFIKDTIELVYDGNPRCLDVFPFSEIKDFIIGKNGIVEIPKKYGGVSFEKNDLIVRSLDGIYSVRIDTKIISIDLSSNPDARVWAEEYCRINPTADIDVIYGWFANAMMAMSDHIHQTKNVTDKQNDNEILSTVDVELRELSKQLFATRHNDVERIGSIGSIGYRLQEIYHELHNRDNKPTISESITSLQRQINHLTDRINELANIVNIGGNLR